MCGIAGLSLASGAAVDAGLLTRLAAALAHRGPDGSGCFVTGEVALVHTRLAIIDLATGDQPISNGPLTLIANGEIYNYKVLKETLPGPFATMSDCEPPLKLFARASADYTKFLRGMYAIALHDGAFHTLTLSRDLFGIKPLYIAQTAQGLAFASEPQVLLDSGLVARGVDAQKLHELLNLQFTTGAQSIFSGIQRVTPGETLTVRRGKIIRRARLPFPTPASPPTSEANALARLDAVLQETVDLHQRSDVPYGMFLSGGIDSSAILAMMARLNATPVLAYTAGFDEPGIADEREAAAITAKAVGARHERIEIGQKMVWEHLPEIVAAMDDPVADYAIIPSWFLARRARQDVKVILSGEGGDEMFAGYGRYRAAARLLGRKKMRAKGVFDGLELLRNNSPTWRDGIAAAEIAHKSPSRLQTVRHVDIADWLPHDLLLKLDRCLMAHGIEGRTPFIDPEIAAFAFSLPDKMLVRRGLGKYLLRLWLEKNLPTARPFAKKQGFDVPVGAWIAAQSKPLGELLARQPVIAELAQPDKVQALLARAGEKRFGFAAWVLLFTALWHRRHVLNLPPAGDVFTTLRDI
ncbi:MAG: asparagine synthase (glutamine-hydrolyzing) [Acidocella sp. 20-63-7]|nr:MAG: asparagine synthase (glutamine-hydrolyzing) [Acidocella sp. 20-63-7]HQT46526.1 asparagine synthase (glutamine-hydrolyzing) [Acidocella sp.]